MTNILERLQIDADLTGPQAKESLLVIHYWLEQHYPILAVISKTTVLKEIFEEQESKKELTLRTAPANVKLSRA